MFCTNTVLYGSIWEHLFGEITNSENYESEPQAFPSLLWCSWSILQYFMCNVEFMARVYSTWRSRPNILNSGYEDGLRRICIWLSHKISPKRHPRASSMTSSIIVAPRIAENHSLHAVTVWQTKTFPGLDVWMVLRIVQQHLIVAVSSVAHSRSNLTLCL